MDKEVIEKRIAELKRSLEQVQANGNALIGAIQENENWLAMMSKEAKTVVEKKGNG